jgi:hypothetical protein
MVSRRKRKLHAMKNQLALTDDDLHELAEVILRRDVSSLRTLDDAQVCRLLDALEGAEKVIFLLASR